MKTILITGGAGFIGGNFVRYIYDKYPDYKIIVLDALTYAGNTDNFPDSMKDDPRFVFWYGNVRNGELVDELVSQSDAVIHFAAESHVARSIFDNTIFYETDVLGTQVVANAVLKYNGKIERFIHISSSEVYGTALQEPMTEEHYLNPKTPYASAKAGADRLVYSYWATYDIPAIILRPFNNYGPHQHLEKVIPRFITSALLNEPLTVHGDGKSQRDWVFVEDCCNAVDRAMHCDLNKVKGEVINIGTGRSIDIVTIAHLVLKLMKKEESLIKFISDRPGQVEKHISSSEKSQRLLGWSPTKDFESGLIKTIEWYKNNEQWWRKLLWMRSIPIVAKDGKRELY
jgi:dTDP-glucose 4,6-dehydratase